MRFETEKPPKSVLNLWRFCYFQKWSFLIESFERNCFMDRVEKAFLIVPIVFSAGVAPYFTEYEVNGLYFITCIVGVFITFPLTVVFGVPAYIIFKRLNLLNWKTCLIYTSFVGAIAGATLEYRILAGYPGIYTGDQGWLVYQHKVTLAGYHNVLEMSLVSAVAGALGGIVFWRIVLVPLDSSR
jgi:hypothetical protein